MRWCQIIEARVGTSTRQLRRVRAGCQVGRCWWRNTGIGIEGDAAAAARIVMDWGGVKCYFYCTLRWLYKEGAVKGDHEVQCSLDTEP